MQVATAVVAVVVDLSQPAQVLQSAVTYLQLVRANLQTSYGWLEQKGSKLPEQMRLRARKYIGSSHEDKDAIQHLGEPICKIHRPWSSTESVDDPCLPFVQVQQTAASAHCAPHHLP